MNFRYDSDY